MNNEVTAKHRYARLSPKKTAIVMDLVRGKSLEEAKIILSFDKTKPAKIVLKVIKSAEANALNKNIDISSLTLSEIYVSPGPMQKRWKAGSRGRVDPFVRRTSHIYVKLSGPVIETPKKAEPKKEEKPVKKTEKKEVTKKEEKK
ncbi:50S ribosomal protein L22 [Patescibacteria group bacterium]